MLLLNEFFIKLLNDWPFKLLFGTIVAAFAPFKISIIILFIMIIIDTLCGSIYAVKIKKFRSSKFKKFLPKLITYFLAVIVSRLLEIGLSELFETILITKIIIGFLTLTEAMSIMEKLTLMGVPIPSGLLNFILKAIKKLTLGDLFTEATAIQEYINEMNDMINYQVPNIHPDELQEMVLIKLEEWKRAISLIDVQFSNNETINNELLFLRLTGIATATSSLVEEKWEKAGIPADYISKVNKNHRPRVDNWTTSIKEICMNSDKLENKKKAVIEKIIVLMYLYVLDIQKEGTNIINNKQESTAKIL